LRLKRKLKQRGNEQVEAVPAEEVLHLLPHRLPRLPLV
jgi:hypothetical protein